MFSFELHEFGRFPVVFDDRPDVHRLGCGYPPARKGQKVLDDRRGLLPGLPDDRNGLPQRIILREVHENEFRVADKTAQDVVEVVSHASCESSDGLHLPRLLKPGFEFLSLFLRLDPLSDIPADASETLRITLVVPHQRDRGLHVDLRPVLPDEIPPVPLVVRACSENPVEYLEGFLRAGLVHERSVVHAHHLVPAITEHPAHGVVEKGEVPAQIDLIIAVLNILQDRPVLFLALLQPDFRTEAVGDIPGRAPHPDDLSFFLYERIPIFQHSHPFIGVQHGDVTLVHPIPQNPVDIRIELMPVFRLHDILDIDHSMIVLRKIPSRSPGLVGFINVQAAVKVVEIEIVRHIVKDIPEPLLTL